MFIAVLTFTVCLAGGFIPAISAELYLLGVAALVGPAMLPVLVVVATAGQVVGKTATYLLAGCAGRRQRTDRGRGGRPIRRLRLLVRRRPRLACAVVGLSAMTSIPPFFAVTAVCGGLRFGLTRFLVVAAAGRVIRNAVIVAAPSLLRGAS